MARTRFRSDRGLTLRMGGVGLGLGALYVAFGAVLVAYSGSATMGIVIVLTMSWGQWYFSDTLALKSMGAREVTPEQAPELHAMIDRLCALADMKKPRVAVSVTDMPNAFATGRSPNHSSVCVTTFTPASRASFRASQIALGSLAETTRPPTACCVAVLM